MYFSQLYFKEEKTFEVGFLVSLKDHILLVLVDIIF